MKLSLLLTLTTSSTLAFAPCSQHAATTALHDMSFNPLKDYRSIDWDRAKECAESFGECSLEELEDLRSNLHRERLQHLAVHTTRPDTGTDWEHQLLEEELDLQLGLLKDRIGSSASTLFPDNVEELPHLQDGTPGTKAQNAVNKANQDLLYEQTVLNEGTLETIAMCAVVVALTLAPQIFLH